MNDLMRTTAQEITMTSREIAELTGKEHRNVMADIRTMLTELHGEIGLLNFQQSYINSQNKEQPEFRLPKRETLILVSGYSVAMRATIIDRWQELEKKSAIDPMQVLNNPELMRGYLLTYSEKIISLESKVIALMPKVEAFERLTIADGEVSLQTAGKLLQQRPNKFIQWLREIGWLYKRAGSQNNLPVAAKFNAGYLTVREAILIKADGTEQLRQQTVVTAKGLSKLAMLLGVNVQPDLLEA